LANQPIHNPKDYSEVLYSIMTTDPVRADLVNSILERLINNDAYLKDYTDAQLAGKVAQGDFNTHLAETTHQGGKIYAYNNFWGGF